MDTSTNIERVEVEETHQEQFLATTVFLEGEKADGVKGQKSQSW